MNFRFYYKILFQHRDNPSKFSTDQLKADFKRFITILSNATYENLEDIPKNNTFGIDSEDWIDLLYNLSSKFNPEISSGTSSKLYMIDTVTELGFCHSINTKIAGYNSYKYVTGVDMLDMLVLINYFYYYYFIMVTILIIIHPIYIHVLFMRYNFSHRFIFTNFCPICTNMGTMMCVRADIGKVTVGTCCRTIIQSSFIRWMVKFMH